MADPQARIGCFMFQRFSTLTLKNIDDATPRRTRTLGHLTWHVPKKNQMFRGWDWCPVMFHITQLVGRFHFRQIFVLVMSNKIPKKRHLPTPVFSWSVGKTHFVWVTQFWPIAIPGLWWSALWGAPSTHRFWWFWNIVKKKTSLLCKHLWDRIRDEIYGKYTASVHSHLAIWWSRNFIERESNGSQRHTGSWGRGVPSLQSQSACCISSCVSNCSIHRIFCDLFELGFLRGKNGRTWHRYLGRLTDPTQLEE